MAQAARVENPNRQERVSTVQWAIENIAGTYGDIAEVASKLRLAANTCHLIGGASIPALPEGYELQVAVIPIVKADCYPLNKKKDEAPRNGVEVAPKFGIPKHTLMQIAAAAGVEWVESRRIDNGRDARYVHWRAVLRYPLVDGTFRTVEGDRDVDLRDNSDQIASKSEAEVGKLRENILRAAVTKAKLRAIREAFGVSQGMVEADLDKPFVACKAVFTGRSKDRENAKLFAKVIAQKQLMASAALYGSQFAGLLGPGPVKALPRPVPAAADPDLMGGFDDDGVTPAEVIPDSGTQTVAVAPVVESEPEPPPPPPPPKPAPPKDMSQIKPNPNFRPAFGSGKGKTLNQLSDKDLRWYEGILEKDIDDPGKSQWRNNNMANLAAIRLEMRSRGEEEPPADDVPPDMDDLPSNY